VRRSGRFDSPFCEGELLRTLSSCSVTSTPGCDGLPYSCFKAAESCAEWRNALLMFMNIVLEASVLPSTWKMGVVVPLHKSGSKTCFSNYRPISLTFCFCKIFERLIFQRISTHIDVQLDDCQAGFRWGSDEHVYVLSEALRLRRGTATWCAFVDIKKAFDTVWRDAALLKLAKAGVDGSVWCLIEDLISDRACRVRVNGQLSSSWSDEAGVGQGCVLSPLLFSLVINSLIADVKRHCAGIQLGGHAGPRLTALLYADDLVILSESKAELQAALDAVHAWGLRWRFQFGIGPEKTAVMCVHPPRDLGPELLLGSQRLPFVTEYKYLGVWIQCRLSWRRHAEHCRSRGDRCLAAVIAWASSERLPLSFQNQLFLTYVLPAALYGAEFISSRSARNALARQLTRWGRRLLHWPAGSPTSAVLGELGWLPFEQQAEIRSAQLLSRLASASPSEHRRLPSSAVFQFALTCAGSWARQATQCLSSHGVPSPGSWHIGPGCPLRIRQRWLHSAVLPVLQSMAVQNHISSCQAHSSLQPYAMLQPFPYFNSRVYGCNNDADEAREWGLARCGHHPCADGRAARHIGSNPLACCLCGSAQCSLEHLLAECSGTADLRSAWLCTHALDEATVAAPELVWLALSSGQMPARFVAANVRFVARSVLRLRRSQSQRR